MKRGKNTLAGYEIFGSNLKDTKEGIELMEAFILRKQTPENLRKLATAVSIVWPQINQESVLDVKRSFSKFQEKLESNKQQISEYLAHEREKKSHFNKQ